MSESERAAFYQEHKDDPDVWSEPVQPPMRRPRRGFSATITVRFTPEEAARIRSAAESSNSSYSDVIRRAVRVLDTREIQIQPASHGASTCTVTGGQAEAKSTAGKRPFSYTSGSRESASTSTASTGNPAAA